MQFPSSLKQDPHYPNSKAIGARKTAGTSFNSRSSRSHAILSISICKSLLEHDSSKSEPYVIGKIEFVDLAGSESNKDADKVKVKPIVGPKSVKDRRAEAISINKSLTTLRRVVQALNENTVGRSGQRFD